MSAPGHVYLCLGTNLGDRPANLQAALAALAPAAAILRVSSIYESEPWGYLEQPTFLNLAVEVETSWPPLDLLADLKEMEVHLGRLPSFRYGPRLIDADILLYGSQVIDLPTLTIPHPRMAERAFVLVPLAELIPDAVHPVLKKTIRELCGQLDPSGIHLYRPLGDLA